MDGEISVKSAADAWVVGLPHERMRAPTTEQVTGPNDVRDAAAAAERMVERSTLGLASKTSLVGYVVGKIVSTSRAVPLSSDFISPF